MIVFAELALCHGQVGLAQHFFGTRCGAGSVAEFRGRLLSDFESALTKVYISLLGPVSATRSGNGYAPSLMILLIIFAPSRQHDEPTGAEPSACRPPPSHHDTVLITQCRNRYVHGIEGTIVSSFLVNATHHCGITLAFTSPDRAGPCRTATWKEEEPCGSCRRTRLMFKNVIPPEATPNFSSSVITRGIGYLCPVVCRSDHRHSVFAIYAPTCTPVCSMSPPISQMHAGFDIVHTAFSVPGLEP